MLAGFKSDMDVKLAAVLRMQTSHQNPDDDFRFSPVSSVQEIQELEQQLEDEGFARRLVNTLNYKTCILYASLLWYFFQALFMKKIVGYTPDNCNGLNVCYSLIDYFFDRKLMLQCSWSGGSRGPAPKFALKSCSNILNTFFEIVHSVNMTFSKNLMEYFFKQITRNSRSRCNAKGLRQPTVHRRGKKVTDEVQGRYTCYKCINIPILTISYFFFKLMMSRISRAEEIILSLTANLEQNVKKTMNQKQIILVDSRKANPFVGFSRRNHLHNVL